MINYIQGTPRNQLVLFNECLDNIINENNQVRFIDAYIERLDLNKLNFVVRNREIGAPSYREQLLLKIYTYGYLERIRSSRRLEKECYRNDELRWLTCDLASDFKTIADFRKDNKEAFKYVFKEFLKFCHRLDLLSLEITAGDGTKIRAQNGNNNIYKRDTIDEVEKKIQEKIDEYTRTLDENDKKEEYELKFDIEKVTKTLDRLRKHKDKVENIKEVFKNDPDLDIYFANDTDSMFQKDNGRSYPGYNAQIVGDNKNKLIIANDVAKENNDLHQMTPMVKGIREIKEELNIDIKTKTALDAGYFNEQEIIKNSDDESIEIIVPDPKEVKRKERFGREKKDKIPTKDFGIDKFIYDKERDVFICPKGKELIRIGKNPYKNSSGKKAYTYLCKECDDCNKKNLCTKSKKGRTLKVSINYEIMQDFKKKMGKDECKEIISKRKEIVEHPFGTIKQTLGYRYFMQKGLEKVKAEFNFICFIYNLKRVLNIFSVEKLIAEV